jgi:hypothetical protein
VYSPLGRSNYLVIHIRTEARDTGRVTLVHHRELHCVIQPVLTRPGVVLGGNRQRVLLARQEAPEPEPHLNAIARTERTQFDALDFGIRAEDFNARADCESACPTIGLFTACETEP